MLIRVYVTPAKNRDFFVYPRLKMSLFEMQIQTLLNNPDQHNEPKISIRVSLGIDNKWIVYPIISKDLQINPLLRKYFSE